jgi:hypothetical protein
VLVTLATYNAARRMYPATGTDLVSARNNSSSGPIQQRPTPPPSDDATGQ